MQINRANPSVERCGLGPLPIGGHLNSRAQELETGANQLVYGLVVRIGSSPKLLVCSEVSHIVLSAL